VTLLLDGFYYVCILLRKMMNFSPIVVTRKHSSSVSSNNPFDEFDIIDLSSEKVGSFPTLGSTRGFAERFDSDDDPFGLFSDDSSFSPVKTAIKKPGSSLKNEIKFKADTREDDDDNDEHRSEEDSIKPPVPPRIKLSDVWTQKIKQSVIPFSADDKTLLTFLSTPLEEGSSLKFIVHSDSASKTLRLLQFGTNRGVLMAVKRTDRLKQWAASSNISIMMMPTDEAIQHAPQFASRDRAASITEPVRIAKLRSNLRCSQYSLFDQGKNPTKTTEAVDVRRELASMVFESVSGVYTRRASYCYLPAAGQVQKPTNKDQMLHKRAKTMDPTVVSLTPWLPQAVARLPKVEDYDGFAKVHSVKNSLLFSADTKKLAFRLAKQENGVFHMEFSHPLSVLTAFAMVVGSFDTKINPSRQ